MKVALSPFGFFNHGYQKPIANYAGIPVTDRSSTMKAKQEESELVVLIFILVIMALVIVAGMSLVL